eukprot:CAMPEP_0168403602 /NCGR_PEP_ID=MMETSP0228-20121227/24210_1 /TAXON_ID=133427 /ORGANISM="Protoceratium reticulatum, Strain CCCM 535 (=CCMP 1889)" /LENGTH=68 /DNA_ID=CAMNT_0008417203 /DNA_START=66 /DNA_END=268 /DNA_ORIENTATION=-
MSAGFDPAASCSPGGVPRGRQRFPGSFAFPHAPISSAGPCQPFLRGIALSQAGGASDDGAGPLHGMTT